MFCKRQNRIIFAPAIKHGTLAQLVEQRTENPCVPGSIPGGTTQPKQVCLGFLFNIYSNVLNMSGIP